MQIGSFIDHTILKPETTVTEVEKRCLEAVEYQFAAVCIPPPFVSRTKQLLSPTNVKVATVVGFPFGYAPTESKLAETLLALVDGADEIDMVINLIALRMNDTKFLQNEVGMLTDAVHQQGKVIKIIVESGILTRNEIITCCSLFAPMGIDFMKTSTGYAQIGATVEAVQLMRRNLPLHINIKASGGIRTYQFARELIAAGATRLGCSASVEIVKEERMLSEPADN